MKQLKTENPPKQERRIKITHSEIINIVAEECEVSVSDILSKSRKQTIVDARYLCFAAIRLRHGLSLQDIGRLVSDRDHTTVIHGLKNFHNRYSTERRYRDMAKRVFEQIQIEYDGNELTSAI
jgi:chromosomal replication initiation ATPase DnaA